MPFIPESALPGFLTRLLRPFTTSSTASLSITESGTSGSALANFPPGTQTATIAAGCFWGVEHLYRKNFGNGKGLLDARVGYCGGDSKSPTYRGVCSGRTGHAEALQIHFDPSVLSYRDILLFFFRMHDPTTLNRQGGDVGTQYRSAIFTSGDEQQGVAEEVKRRVGETWWKGAPVTTEVVRLGEWWDAEDYHQLYLERTPGGYECPAHYLRNFPPLSE